MKKLAQSYSDHAHKLLCKHRTAWVKTRDGWCHQTQQTSKVIGSKMLDIAYDLDENVDFKECHWSSYL